MECPASPDIVETHNSGALVPKPMMTMPMMNGEMPSFRASAADPSTNTSLDQANAKRPPSMKTTESQNGMSEYIVKKGGDRTKVGHRPKHRTILPRRHFS